MNLKEIVEKKFPRLGPGEYEETSPEDKRYNCFAFAAGDQERWWRPRFGFHGYYWPPGAPDDLTLEAFVKAYETRGYQICEAGDIEEGFEKIALFVDGNGVPSHAARQLENGKWASKIDRSYDFSHPLRAIETDEYGEVEVFMRRPSEE